MIRWDEPRKRLEGDDFLYDIELDWFFHVKEKNEEEEEKSGELIKKQGC